MVGDDLIIIFLLSSAFLAGLEAMKATGWRIRAFGALAGVCVCAGLGWHWLKEVYPPFTGWMSSIATNPQSWFILLVLGLVWMATTGRKRTKPIEPDSDRDEIIQAVADVVRKTAFLQGQLNSLQIPAPYDDSDLRSSFGDLDRKASQTHGGLQGFMHVTRESLDQIREEVEKIGDLKKNLTRNNQKIAGFDQDLPVVTEILLESLALSTLFNALPAMPAFTGDIGTLTHVTMKEQMAAARAYQQEVKRVLSETQWGREVPVIMQDAQMLGEEELRQIGEDDRPDIDPLDLRYYMIARKTCQEIEDFIRSERREAATKYIGHLTRLRQRYLERREADRINRNSH
jgi:hypothetical protein